MLSPPDIGEREKAGGDEQGCGSGGPPKFMCTLDASHLLEKEAQEYVESMCGLCTDVRDKWVTRDMLGGVCGMVCVGVPKT